MQPNLQASILCDDIRVENTGKFFIIGVFDTVYFAKLPARKKQLSIYSRWCCGTGSYKHKVRIVRADGSTLIEGKDIPLTLQEQTQTAATAEVFLDVNFSEEGIYWVEVLLDGDLKLRYPFRVVVKTPGELMRPPADGDTGKHA